MKKIFIQDTIIVESPGAGTINFGIDNRDHLKTIVLKDYGYLLSPGKTIFVKVPVELGYSYEYLVSNSITNLGISSKIPRLHVDSEECIYIPLRNTNHQHSIRIMSDTLIGYLKKC